ncbi:PREDICTED: dehydration-responsive element-binding protein 2F-like [Nicotiana attenuata]|uniref:dehydration-responsive element-binding protein 2F-like n=1 Tax=Nicotiana attenuata TaxID=49451 RepID=UPI0009058EF5|nr:PREDICTED: dehydration-responsive element-binding protein 2F-like [Nicotiana attenuata]
MNTTSLLNLSAQPNVHAIHQRLQEHKKIEASSSISSISDPKSEIHNFSKQAHLTISQVKEKEVEFSSQNKSVVQEKPQINLNEFLQQLRKRKRDDDKADKSHDHNISCFTESEGSLKDDSSIANFFADTSYNGDKSGAILGN